MTPTARLVGAAVRASDEGFLKSERFPGSRKAVEHALSRLADAGELVRVRRGLYWRGRETRFGRRPPTAWEVAVAIVGSDGVGPAEWSATNALGLSTQLPGRETLALPGRVPTGVSNVRWVSRSARWARRREALTGLEVAFLEALEGFERFVELPAADATDRLVELLHSGQVRPASLARAAETEPPRTRRRLRDLLNRAGLETLAASVPDAATARPLPTFAA